MEKKEKKVLIWIMVIAALALLVLYSPAGSPDLYLQNKYINLNQGVSFFGRIMNAPKNSNIYQDNNIILPSASTNFTTNIESNNPTVGNEIPTYSQPSHNKAKYNVNYKSESSSQHNGANYVVHISNLSNDNKSGNQTGISNGGLQSYGTNKASNNNSETKNPSFASMNIDMSLSGDSSLFSK